MNIMKWKWTLVCATALVGATVLLDAQAWAGKPVPPPPPIVNPTPIVYQIQFWCTPKGGSGGKNGTNKWGDSVGSYMLGDGTTVIGSYYHATLFHAPIAVTPDTITAIDLHAEMVAHQPELFEPDSVLDGWVIASATDINDQGVIVGWLFPGPYNEDVKLGYVLDTHQGSPDVSNWEFRLLPTDALWSYSQPRRINENGDIVGVYRKPDRTWGVYFIPAGTAGAADVVELLDQNVTTNVFMNNSDPVTGRAAQVAGLYNDGRAFLWTTDSAVQEVLSGINSLQLAGINDSGTIAGSTYTKLLKGGNARYPLRYSTTLDILQILPNANKAAVSINSAGDLAIQYFDEPSYLYHDSWGFLKLDDLIDLSDPNAPAWFNRYTTRYINGAYLAGLGDRITITTNGDATTEFGLASGDITLAYGNRVNFLLIPVPKTPSTQQ